LQAKLNAIKLNSRGNTAAVTSGDYSPRQNIWPNGAGPLQRFPLGPNASWSRLVWHLRQLGENG